ncbi:AbrB/MazE/SpoVT family DNA-binding domain-containing protein [Candidatus Woesearchaeota archaeon]|nr:AbrB/MazE/SpoVT family DNA-binding domain-containing protein [Candidatus Woesearchaeota archaeon]
MEIIETKAKRWGNSIGIVIPSEIAEKEHIKENKIVRLFIIKDNRNVAKETFGLLKGKIKKSAQQIKDELREELYD